MFMNNLKIKLGSYIPYFLTNHLSDLPLVIVRQTGAYLIINNKIYYIYILVISVFYPYTYKNKKQQTILE